MLTSQRAASRGMTLIELMVTLTIAAVLMFAVIPDIGAWIRNLQVRNAAEAIQAGLQQARNEALRRNQPVRFSLVSLTDPSTMDNSCALSSAAGSWVISLRDPSTKCAAAPSDTVDPMLIAKHAVGDGGRNTVVASLQADGVTAATDVTFDSFGRATSAAAVARIDIRHVSSTNARPLRLTLSASGSVRMCDPAVTSTSDPRHC
jgi:type IV fimbrial biogenesis protein FimT